ncbi:MAG: glycosyltransferase family 39 protein [Vicinamibacterales bacterium]
MQIAAVPDLAPRTYALSLLLVLVLAAVLRGMFPVADPPWHTTVGIVWHDEGAWVHNARNKALFGTWSQDAWNPMYIAPVFTALEYASFRAFGVGLWQARLVSEILGWLSVLLLALGVARVAGRRAAVIAAALLATNYVYVMWNRAAMMEGPMTAFMVGSWYCYVRTESSPRWGWGAAAFAFLAFFTKASAAFFVAAIALDALLATMFADSRTSLRVRGAIATLTALVTCGAAALLLFVIPNWTDYQFYNWQMSVTRKPSYDLESLVYRITAFPVLHDLFTRMWFTLTIGTAAALGLLARWRTVSAGERLLGLWLALGALELILHDVGNERRFVLFIPPLIALAAVALGRDRTLLPHEITNVEKRHAWLAAPIIAYTLYVVTAAIIRLGFLYEIRPNVRAAAATATLLTILVLATWPQVPRWLSANHWTPRAGVMLALVVATGQVLQYGQWAAGHTSRNYEASRQLADVLPAGTLVHGKLANGLSLENRIRPVFVGHGFGNFDDRRTRDDVRYILTYVAPRVGYEGSQINDVLDAYPDRTIIMTFDVAETATGYDRAALIDKFGSLPGGKRQTADRAKD